MPHPSTTPLEIAREQLLSAAAGWSPQQEICGVSNALGRVLATEQISSVDLPQTDNVAVDGYAVEAAFLASHPDHLFKVAGTARAGHPFAGSAAPGEAVRVFTGAVMPEGPDCVIMHEDCQSN
jgi:molybdopterin molybdotransferase